MTTKIRLLLADDHKMLRAGLRALLDAQPDLTVVGEVSNGHEAVLAAQKLQPDVVILDISMTDLNGIEATRQICAGGPSTRVIILSMHASNRYIHQALQAGASGYILKESAAEKLIEGIHTVITGQRYLCSKVENRLIEDYIAQPLPEAGSELHKLTDNERAILQLVVEGKSSNQIGATLHLSPKTVDSYRSHIMQKLDLHDIPSLVKFAIRSGLITLE